MSRSNLIRLFSLVVFLLWFCGCDSSDDVFEKGLPEDYYLVKSDDGNLVDMRTSLYPSEGPSQYSFKGKTFYLLVPFSDEGFIDKIKGVVSLENYVTQLAPIYSQYTFFQGEVLRVLVAFRGLESAKNGIASVSGSMKIINSEGVTLFQTESLELYHNKPLRNDEIAASSQTVTFQIPANLNPGTYTIHFDLHDEAYNIEIPLRAEIKISNLDDFRAQRISADWSAGWENEGAPFQLFMNKDSKVLDYLSNKLPKKTFYEYARSNHQKSISRGEDFYAGIAFTNPTANNFLGGCNISVNYLLYDQKGRELVTLRHGNVCKEGTYSAEETTLGNQRFAINFPTESPPGDYLLVAEIFDAVAGKKYELGQTVAVK